MKISLNLGKNDKKGQVPVEKPSTQPAQGETDMGAIAAAVGLALSMYMQDIHDNERAIITMQKVMRPYSPWSSKIYGLRERPMFIPRSRR